MAPTLRTPKRSSSTPDGNLERGVGPTVGAEKIAEGDGGDPESFVQRLLGDGDVYAVEIS